MNKSALLLVFFFSVLLNLKAHNHSKPNNEFAGVAAEHCYGAVKNSVKKVLSMTNVVLGIPFAFRG
jgi:hypothetical protein